MREILRGDLEVLNLASVLQLIEAEAVTGLMTFDQGAEIRFKHGQLVSATIGHRKGVQAVEEMFLTPMATFVLSQAEVQEERVLGMMTGVIMSGLRLSDEWARLSPLVLGPRPGREIKDPALAALVKQMDGARTFVEVVFDLIDEKGAGGWYLFGTVAPFPELDIDLAALERWLRTQPGARSSPTTGTAA